MMFAIGPQPDRKVIEDRPDGVSVEAAMMAWHAGYNDAHNARPYHVFPDDAAELQALYSNGFERGEVDRRHVERVNGRIPEAERAGSSAAEEPAVEAGSAGSARAKARSAARWAEDNPGLVNSGAILAGALAIAAAVASR